MQKGLANRLRFLALCIVLTIPFVNTKLLLAGTQGFGMMKKDRHFFRHRPPKIFLNDADVALRVTSPDSFTGISSLSLKNRIQSAIRAGDESIRLNSPEPRILLDVQCSDVTRSESWTKKSEYEKQKTGEEEVWNEKKQKMEKKDIYKTVKVEVPYLQINWKAYITLRIEDIKTNTTLGSDSYKYAKDQEFKEGKYAQKSPPGIEIWADSIAIRIAGNIVPIREEVRILLPKGKLDAVSDKIEEHKLAEALQKLEDMPPLKNPKDEAYKVYILGACYEAMAYEKDRTSLLHGYLELAAKNYAKAIEMKPDEKYFHEAQERLQASIRMYKILTERHYAFRETKSDTSRKELKEQPIAVSLNKPSSQPAQSESVTPPAIEPKPEPKPESKPELKPESRPQTRSPWHNDTVSESASVITNETIVRLVKAGLSEENIIATINEAKLTSFDLSPNAQVQLIQSGVTNRIISAMRQVKKSN